ncbi:GlsB/YeaQ/YmgE family stress response membrane protein [Patescibacteria group bacterium]|nr:GlsB/YeaQ/YmgE family stress response membrane protein [Patescibacteria group bacterium]
MLNLLLWIVFGAVVGLIATSVMGTNRKGSLITDVIVGILGALVGGLIASIFGVSGVTGFNIYSLVIAIIGAIILIWGERMLYQ